MVRQQLGKIAGTAPPFQNVLCIGYTFFQIKEKPMGHLALNDGIFIIGIGRTIHLPDQPLPFLFQPSSPPLQINTEYFVFYKENSILPGFSSPCSLLSPAG
jgi:hypothetical protein